MGTLLTILLVAIVVGFLYRAMKLHNLMKTAIYYAANHTAESSEAQAQFQIASGGCLGCMCFPFLCLFFAIPIYLFLKIDQWIPIVGFIVGLTIANLVGFIVERLLQLPNHQTFEFSSINLNAMELSVSNELYRKALGQLIFYNVVSLILSVVIVFS